MRRLYALAFVLLLGLGCAAAGDQGEWDEFWKDLRGDNMKMRSDFARDKGMDDAPPSKARDGALAP